jgi:hypothetical protein
MKTLILILMIIMRQQVHGTVVWPNGQTWTYGCDWHNRNLQSQKTTIDQCEPVCQASPKCTHFTWSSGTCWLKYGNVNPSDAISVNDQKLICGYIQSKVDVSSTKNKIEIKYFQKIHKQYELCKVQVCSLIRRPHGPATGTK